MWLPSTIVAQVDEVARIHYIDVGACQRWNEQRKSGELRLLTGWCWTSKAGNRHQQGLKTLTACYRDAWYALVQQTSTPRIASSRAKLRVVA